MSTELIERDEMRQIACGISCYTKRTDRAPTCSRRLDLAAMRVGETKHKQDYGVDRTKIGVTY